MSTPERRPSGSRHREQHNQQQQHSPFRRAHRDPDDFDASLIPSPSRSTSTRHRRHFSQTGTLRGAFEVASRLPIIDDGDEFLRKTTSAPYRSTLGGALNKRRRESTYSAMSHDSNPPNELAEVYRRIDDEGSLNDLGASDDENQDFQMQVGDLRSRRWSSNSSIRENGGFMPSGGSYTDESPRRRLVDYTRDEQRLKQATSSRSPVLNRAVASAALTSENLQRREEEEEEKHQNAQAEGLRLTTGMKVPSTWGSRGKYRQDWLASFTRNHSIGLESAADEQGDLPPRKPLAELTLKHSPPEPTSTTARIALGARSPSRRDRFPLAETLNRISFDYNAKLSEGEQIPNTPISIHKNSILTKRSPSKRDSHDLLKRLARTESPPQDQFKTPEQPARERRIYDKTPVVTGAWIDTPMTERGELPEREIVRSASKTKFENSPNKPYPQAHEKTSLAADWKSKWRGEGYKTSGKILEELPEEVERADEAIENPQSEEIREESKGKAKEVKQERQKEDEKEGKRPELEKGDKQNKPPLVLVKPDLPKSALETVLQDHKDNKDPLDVGDDTIESLQIIMDGQPTGLKTEEEDDVAYEKAVLEKLELANPGPLDVVDLDRLNGKLQSLSYNISKVKVGLNNLEDQVSRDNHVLASTPRSPDGSLSAGHVYPNGVHNDGRIYASIPLPRLWKRTPLRPTRLGWAIVVLLTWFFSESTMCDYYCHPFVATVCEGNCLLPNAPRFPFVIPTMLWRWLHLSAIITPLGALLLALLRLASQLFGLWDGYVDDGPPVVNLSGDVWIHGSRVGGFPTATATATTPAPTPGFFSSQQKWQWKKEDKHTPEAAPTLDIRTNMAGNSWEDDVSMDDDEYLSP